MKIIFTLLIFVAVATHAEARKRCFPVPAPVVDPPPTPPACSKHEVYSDCGANGCQSTCANPTLNQVCKAMCIAGCICEEGYLRDSNGKCVLAKDCAQITDPPVKVCKKANESYKTCGTACPLTCEKPIPGPCTKQCVKGCFCDAGYVRDKKGNCVLVEDCPKPIEVCKKAHESYTTCGTACPLTCENPIPGICTEQCVMGCFCDAGYVRDKKGNCVLVEDCPKPIEVCKKAHESYTTCGTACPLTCENPIPGPCTKQCVKGCFCDAGYVRDKKGNCVLVEDCPKPKCGKNENYNDCGGSPCQATCENPNLPQMCKAPCKPGCGCDEGYVRDNDGNCILLKKCPQKLKCEDNEVYEACSTLCGEPTCENSRAFYCGAGCEPKCLCKEGYVRNAEKKCIKAKNCPAQCKPFEIFSECAPEACKKTCDTLNTACKAPCVPGCKCPEGKVYFDDNRDKCVSPKKCPAIIVDPPACALAHESYTECGTACPLTCENVNNPPMFCTANCVVGCSCDSGYVRAKDGSCILPKNCPASVSPNPVCSGKHESYSECGAYCQRTCGPPTPCARPLQDCNPGCVCDAGYVRETHNGKCILSKKCPK